MKKLAIGMILAASTANAAMVGQTPPTFPVAGSDPTNQIVFLTRSRNIDYYTETGLATVDGQTGYFDIMWADPMPRGFGYVAGATYHVEMYSVTCPYFYTKRAVTNGFFWDLRQGITTVGAPQPQFPPGGDSPAGIRAAQVCMSMQLLLKQ